MIDKKLLRFEFMRGQGNGGQNRNKLDTACRVTHIPTGTTGYADCRTQPQSKKKALSTLFRKLENARIEKRAAAKKKRRDEKIHDKTRVRTYDFKAGVVIDHRTKKRASIKDVVGKGRIDLLR